MIRAGQTGYSKINKEAKRDKIKRIEQKKKNIKKTCRQKQNVIKCAGIQDYSRKTKITTISEREQREQQKFQI